jgi:hypothetical protein
MSVVTKIRCSSLPRIAACPGSLLACEGVVSADSAQSLAGSAGHAALERYFKQPFDADILPIEAFIDTLDSMTASRARWYANTIDKLIEEHSGAGEILTEVEMSAIICDGFELTGHADLIVPCKDGITLLIDYKFNYLDVPRAAQNLQLMGYAWLWSQGFAYPDTIHAILTAGGNEDPFTAAEYTPERIVTARDHLERIVKKTVLDPVRNPSEEACKYCQAKCTTRCPETLGQLSTGCTLMARPESLLPAIKKDAADLRSKAKELIKLAEAYIARIDDEVKADPEAWAEYFTLQSTGSTREVKDVQSCYNTLVTNEGLVTHEQFFDALKVSITKLEDASKPVLKERGVPVKDQKMMIAGLLGDNLELKEKAQSVKAVKQ